MKLSQQMFCLATILLSASASRADMVTLTTSRDNTIFQDAPGNGDGAGQVLFVGTTGQGSPRRALIGFDIAGNVPVGSTITGVQLRLVLDRAASGEFTPRPVPLCRVLADWGEGTAGRGSGGAGSGDGFPTVANGTGSTWTHRFYNTVPWTNPGGDFTTTASGSTVVGTVSNMATVWNSSPGMVSDVQAWLTNPSSNFGWLLLGDESTSTTARRFFTREAGNSASRPSLVVTFTPPSSAPTSRLLVAAAASTTAGSPFDVTVTALDNNGNVATGYTGTVTFTGSGAFPAVLPADYVFTSGDQGTHTFSGGATFFSAGSQTLTAQDRADGSIMGSATVAVMAAPANHLLITAPANAVSGTPFDVTVAALDPYGNVDANYGGTITWATTDTDRGIVLPGDYSFQGADSGIHTFPAGIVLVTLGDQTIAAADTVSGIGGFATVTVGPGP